MAAKSFSGEMAKEYIAKDVEEGWYGWWKDQGFFKPSGTGEPFVIVLPPPNVTGKLHLGHALTSSVQDTVVRYHRMSGRNTLYLPGTDHAGIATQVVVEKRLKAETGKSRHDLGRDDFLKKVWEFKEQHANFIQEQLRQLGSSLDWTRERFTMDDQCARAVTEAFVQLHEQGKLYRATRLVNWCCALQSAISDLEVEHEDVEKNTKTTVPGYDRRVDIGQLWSVAYKIEGMPDKEIVISTTRPETILGDTAVAVHPDDARYKDLHGKRLICPFRDETIPIILDKTLVKMEFGTGAVKVTPSHDPNDFECGKRHNLPHIQVLDLKGNICVEGEFFGQNRFACRYTIIEALKAKDLLRNVEGHAMSVGRCSRTKDIVEPMLMPQWFVDCESMAAASVSAVEKGELKLIPDWHKGTWDSYLKNIKPWCVSRQLWWGHRIPAYECTLAGKKLEAADGETWVVARDEDEARTKAKAQFNLSEEDSKKIELARDPDVLDTWFSSGLWPFSTMGWPTKTDDLATFFPGHLLETGHDILFFWVARMVMMSLHFTGKLPFTEVFLHAMVRDRDGRKMSKTLGNVINPTDVVFGTTLQALHDQLLTGNIDAKEIERAKKFQKDAFKDGIPACGSDALRFGLLAYTQSGRTVNLDVDRIVGYKQFCNKLWNVTRYILYHALATKEGEPAFRPAFDVTAEKAKTLPLECRWILSRLDLAAEEANAGIAGYDFAAATNAIYRFWLYELCDVFLELTKPVCANSAEDNAERKAATQTTLLYVVERGLRLLHPTMPFVSEELWNRLPHRATFTEPSLMIASYPKPVGFRSAAVEADMKAVTDVAHACRSMKAQYNLTKSKPECFVLCTTDDLLAMMKQQTSLVSTLGFVDKVTAIAKGDAIPEGCGSYTVNHELVLNMMLKGHIDVAKEIAKIDKQTIIVQKSLDGTVKKTTIPNYETKVPEDVRKANTEKIATLKMELEHLSDSKKRMEAMQ